MQIKTETTGDLFELHVQGRLDNNWSGHLTNAIDDGLRQGYHRVVLDLSGVEYISSAGISVLVSAHQQLQAIKGFFAVCEASPQVEEVLRLTGLAKMLIYDLAKARSAPSVGLTTMQPMFRVASDRGMDLELFDLHRGKVIRCRTIGDPGLLANGQFEAQHCRNVAFPATTFGLGLGAFGASFEECQSRFGEFLAVAGTAAQLPTGSSSKPDYQVAAGTFVPEAKTLYGLTCEGELAQLIRFEPTEDHGVTPLSDLVEQCLNMSEAGLAGMVIVAETDGLIGAALSRSPALVAASGTSRFEHPEIRNWLAFTPEHTFSRSLALIVGVAARGELPEFALPLAPFLRPLGTGGSLQGHFHAAVFSYRPLKRGNLNLRQTVATLFESEELQGVLHLLGDHRAISGAGESEFVRGACWIGPIVGVSSEDN